MQCLILKKVSWVCNDMNLFYLLVFYLATLSVTKIINRQNNTFVKEWKKTIVA
jgi:hypothetical protein